MYAICNAVTALLLSLMLVSQAVAQTDTDCEQDFFALTLALKEAGIVDAQAKTLPDHPHLGINRWLAYQQQQATSHAQQQQWIRLATDKAWQDLSVMIQRLPVASTPFNPDSAQALIDTCLPVLAARTAFEGLPQAEIPDSYATWLRVAGLYPLTAWLATGSINNYHEAMSARFVAPPPSAKQQYLPPASSGAPLAPSAVAENPLNIPLPDDEQQQDLFTHYAPVITVADQQSWNQPGRVELVSNATPTVYSRDPVSYTWTSWTRFRGENLLQLNYQFWFSQRPKTGFFDGYGGDLDGLIWRVTLKPDGGVLFYDSIHPCGCYHKIYPVDPGLKKAEIDGDKPVYYPERVADAREQRIRLVLEPDTHYLVRVSSEAVRVPGKDYRLLRADDLRALRQREGGVGSLFNKQGLVPVSKRGERFYLWPMGVPSAGAMRQPGEHAIAFKGRRHFDAPELPSTLFE